MDELLPLLTKFVSFQTTLPEAKNSCLSWIISEFLADAGLPVERGDVEGNAYLHLRHPSPSLVWFAHADVVPGRPDQFAVRMEGDRALGRGVKDMKGAALTFLIAYRNACRAGRVPPVSVLVTTDEETGGHSPPFLLERGDFDGASIAFTPDTGETPHIVTEIKGAVWVRLVAEGSSGHGAAPWACDNPVPLLLRAVESVMRAFPPGRSGDWRVTASPTMLNGSDAINRVPGEASCVIDMRFPSAVAASPEAALELLRPHLPPKCRLEIVETAHPLCVDSAHPMVSRIKRLAEEVTGTPVAIGREHGSSDARSFGKRGIPAFLYGPEGGDLHGAAEWVSIPSLRQHVILNSRLLEELFVESRDRRKN